MTKWQPIETAPTCGLKFIALLDDGRAATAYMQRYYDKWPHMEGGPTYRHTWTLDEGHQLTPWSNIKGWMPLPEPPKESEDE